MVEQTTERVAHIEADQELIADLLVLARRVAEHFQDTDAPLGQLARQIIAKADGQESR